MIKLDFRRFIYERVWFGWWYAITGLGDCRWKFERHPAVPLFSILTLKDARNRVWIYEEWKDREGELDYN